MGKSIIYTGTGDSGTTSLVGGSRVRKDDVRIEAYGTVDELSSAIGLIESARELPAKEQETLRWIQHRLFNIGSYLATENDSPYKTMAVGSDDVGHLEEAIDRIDSQLPPIRQFILPGGSELSSRCHLARTICRRAERRILTLSGHTPIDQQVLRFINRLSDFLFILARFNNIKSGHEEIFWDKNC